MIKGRKPIYNERGERICDIVRTEKKIYLETSYKGKIKRITLAEELYQIFCFLSPGERLKMYEEVRGRIEREDMSIA